MSERTARLALLVVIVALGVAVWPVRLPHFWGDGSTYYAMTWSLAADGDLKYEAADLARIRREMSEGPQGIFMKRATGGFEWSSGFPWLERVTERHIYYAKAFAYPLAAAPLVHLVGTRGLLLTNVLFLGLALVAIYAELRRRGSRPGAALGAAVALLLATVAPIYVLWPAPEIFNLGVLAAALWAWGRGCPLLSAVLFGVAFYSKPYNLFVALPLGLDPVLRQPWREHLWPGILEMLKRGGVMAAVGFGLFGANALVTGEANYQGGERKTFYGEQFPGERRTDGTKVTFGNSGIWMTTMQLGPAVEGRENVEARGAEPPRSRGEIWQSFLWNLLWFWTGRFGGALAYYLPAVVALLAWLAVGPRDRAGGLAVAAIVVSWLFYILMIPDNWYGGGGTVGNRYFLNLLPLAAYLVPRGRERLVVGAGVASVALFVGPLLASPLRHSLRPGDHATQGAFRMLPVELSMLNDLSVFTEGWRKKRSVGDTEGNAHTGWPADPRSYYLYFLDDGTWGLETHHDEAGFWLRGGQEAQLVLRALEPVVVITATLVGGPDGDRVTLSAGAEAATLELEAGQSAMVRVRPGSPFVYKDSFAHILKLRSERSGPRPFGAQLRQVGAFVHLDIETKPRRRTPPPP